MMVFSWLNVFIFLPKTMKKKDLVCYLLGLIIDYFLVQFFMALILGLKFLIEYLRRGILVKLLDVCLLMLFR